MPTLSLETKKSSLSSLSKEILSPLYQKYCHCNLHLFHTSVAHYKCSHQFHTSFTQQVFHTSFTLQVFHTCQSDLQFVHCASSSRSPELYTSSYSFMTSQGFREGMFFLLNFIEQLNDKWLIHVSWEHMEIWGNKQYRND